MPSYRNQQIALQILNNTIFSRNIFDEQTHLGNHGMTKTNKTNIYERNGIKVLLCGVDKGKLFVFKIIFRRFRMFPYNKPKKTFYTQCGGNLAWTLNKLFLTLQKFSENSRTYVSWKPTLKMKRSLIII